MSDVGLNKKLPQNATIAWDDADHPVSSVFDDVYFSRENGLNETQYVFLEQNELPLRFSNLKPHQSFTVAETGFGSGLNFLATWRLFRQFSPTESCLHFVSVEKFPLISSDLKKVHQLWPELKEYADQLLFSYSKLLHQRFHYLVFDQGRVRLTLIFDDVCHAISELSGTIDAWFLDGFSPSKNPDMWTPELFKSMSYLSCPYTTYSTFTASGIVKRGLAKAGFSVRLIKGYGSKRHMIKGRFISKNIRPSRERSKIWLERHTMDVKSRIAIIIGAGLAGCSTALALAQKGWHVTILDKAEKIATEASGNRQGALYMRLANTDTLLSSLLIQGYEYTSSLLTLLLKSKEHLFWENCGLVQLGFDEKERCRQKNIINRTNNSLFARHLSPELLSEKSGLLLNTSGLWFEQGGWVQPSEFCKAILANKNISFKPGYIVESLVYENNQWTVCTKNKPEITSPVVVIANNHEAADFDQTQHLPLKKVRGQVSYLKSTDSSEKLSAVLCGKSYVLPAMEGLHTLGATHQFSDEDCTVRVSDHEENMNNLKKNFPSVYSALNGDKVKLEEVKGKTGFRCSTPDYLPIVGAVADAKIFKERFAPLANDAKYRFKEEPAYLPGLYVNTGHGSRGLITCPLSGELLASLISNEILPVSMNIARAVNPNRFLARELIRSKQKK